MEVRRFLFCCSSSATATCNRKKRPPLSKRTDIQFFSLDPSSSPSTPTSTCNAGAHPPKSTVTGTIFGQRRGRARFCIQQHPHALLLELSMPTCLLVKEMTSGLLRISLECERSELNSCSLQSVPVWSMHCNGRKVGYATRRRATEKDKEVLRTVQATSVGAGVIPAAGPGEEEVMFMRASYERVVGSRDSEAFHLINPSGCPGQELSVFLLRAG